jgi:hypothetical protein
MRHRSSSASSIVVSLLAVVCCGGLAYLLARWRKRGKRKQGMKLDAEEDKGGRGATGSAGYLVVRVKGGGGARPLYLTASEPVFPRHPENKTVLLHLTASPKTLWEAEQVRAGAQTDGRFILKTRFAGKMYSIQSGAPGFGVPYGMAFAGDMGRPYGTNVVFRIVKGPGGPVFASVSSTWPDGDFRSLALASDQRVVFWANETGFESMRFASAP